MEEVLQNIDLRNLDKTDWQTYKFEEIARKVSETVKPEEANVDVYVGLEHLDADDIHIRRTGVPSDVKGGKLKCFPGDVVFGKRRAYQRKAAIVDFDGICSAHAFVFRANPEVIHPSFFPFFLHSDEFMHRMVDISVGGLSPTINWGDLKYQEFLLPPKDQQADLAELLWAMDEVIERERDLLGETKRLIRATQKLLYNKEIFKRIKLENYSTILGGYAFSSKSFVNSGIPVVKIKNLVKGEILIEDNSNHIGFENNIKTDKFSLNEGDILIAMTGATLGKIGVVQKRYHGALLNQRVGKFELKRGVNKWFLKGVLNSDYFLCELNKYIGEGAQGNISSEDIAKTLVPALSDSEKVAYGVRFNKLYNSVQFLEMKLMASQSLQESLINQIF